MNQRGFRTLSVIAIVLAAMFVAWRLLTWLFRWAPWLALPLLLLTAIFLIVLILIQRGKGGGLSGAFGGLGGQSAFGTKAGDMFTRITIGVAAAWIFLCILSVRALTPTGTGLNLGTDNPAVEQEERSPGQESGPVGATGDAGGGERAPSSEDD